MSDEHQIPDYIDTYILPAHFASALVNDDRSGLSDEDEKELDEWLEKTQPGYCMMIKDGDAWFSWHNDMNSLGATVTEFYFDNRKNDIP